MDKHNEHNITHFRYRIFANNGNGLIEFAILLPVFILLILGVIEFGWYFIKDETVTRAVSTVALAIQQNPNPDSTTIASLQSLADSSGAGVIEPPLSQQFNGVTANNVICAETYVTLAEAQAAAAGPNAVNTICNYTWSLSNPNTNGTTTPYYAAIVAYVPFKAITPIANFLGSGFALNITRTSVIQVGGAVASAATPTVFSFTACGLYRNQNTAQCAGTANLPVAMPNANYALICTVSGNVSYGSCAPSLGISIGSQNATSFNYNLSQTTDNGCGYDTPIVNCVVYPSTSVVSR